MKIVFSVDDGAASDFKMADLLKKYEIPGIFYWPYNLEKSSNMSRVKKFLTMEQCVELSKEFEVGSHTISHQFLTKISLQAARNEIFDSKKLWEDKLGREITKFCYPRGYTNTIVKAMTKNAGYKEARTTIVGHLKPANDLFAQPTTLHVGIDRIEYNNKSWELFGKEMLEKANEDSLFHIFGHSWEIDLFNDWGNLEEFLKLITGK